MKKILGLDLGTNSIGWAVVEKDINLIEWYKKVEFLIFEPSGSPPWRRPS